MAEELKACPFCGQSDFLIERLDNCSSVVICQGMVDEHSACLAQGPVAIQDDDGEEQPGRDAAIREWNNRAQLHSQGGEAVAMRQRFSQIEDEIMAGKHTAASVFTQMRTAALYTHPADQVAEPGTKSVPVELLVLIEQSWRVPNGLPKSVPEHVEQKITAGLSQLRAILATPSPK